MPYNEWGDIDEDKDLYKEYYKWSNSHDEYSGYKLNEIYEKIKNKKEAESYQNCC